MARKPSYPEPPDPVEEKRAKALALFTAGETQARIAVRLGVTRQTVSKWLGEPAAAAARESTKALALERIESSMDAAAGVLEQLMRDPEVTAGDRIRASVALLDRGGIIAGQRIEHEGLSDPMRMPLAELEARVRARLSGSTGDPDDPEGE